MRLSTTTCASLRLRHPLPAAVVTVATEAALGAELHAALHPQVTVIEARTAHECARYLETHAGVPIICGVPAPDQESIGERLLDLRANFPNSSWIALFVEQRSDSRWALRLGRAGVTELLPCARVFPVAALIALLSRIEMETVAMRLWKVAAFRLSESLVGVLKPALRLAHAPISLTRFALAAGWHERTLRKYCDHAGLPSPQWIAGWARLLMAAYYLEEPGRTVQSVAELLAFPSAVSLANHVRRYTGMTPTALRAAGAVTTVARLIEVRLASSLSLQERGATPTIHIA